LPSVAVPHSIPPSVEPGADGALQRISPVAASSSQYWPDFWPAPITFRLSVPMLTVNRFGPKPKSKSGPGCCGHALGFGSPGMQATFQSSKPCTPVDHLTAPVSMSKAMIASV